MTNYQSPGRNQRPRGLRLKQALQLTLILAICIWLLYQIKPSDSGKRDYHVESTWNKLSEESKIWVLGRKGSNSGSKGSNFMGENDTKYVSDAENEKKDVTIESPKENKDIAAHGKAEKLGTDAVLDKDKPVMVDHTDEVSTGRDSRSTSQHNEMVLNETICSDMEMEDEAHGFNDENGVPQDLENDYQKINFYRSSISSSQNKEKQHDSSKLHKFVSENENDGTLVEETKNDIKAEADSRNSNIMHLQSKDHDYSGSRSSG